MMLVIMIMIMMVMMMMMMMMEPRMGVWWRRGVYFYDNGDHDNQISCFFSWAIYRVLTGHSYFHISTLYHQQSSE